MTVKIITVGTLVFSLFLVFICLTCAHGYPGAMHYSCGTPAAMIQMTIEFLMPFGVLTSFAGWWFVKSAPVAAFLAGGSALMSLTTWLGTLAFILFIYRP